jgi:hypothetical protein
MESISFYAAFDMEPLRGAVGLPDRTTTEHVMGEHEIEEMWRKQHGISKGSKNQFRVTIVNPAEKIITGDTPYVWGNSLNDGFQLANNLLKDKVLSGLPTKKPLVIEIEEKQGKKRSWHITLEIKRGKWKGGHVLE